jgi:hypothetical protein
MFCLHVDHPNSAQTYTLSLIVGASVRSAALTHVLSNAEGKGFGINKAKRDRGGEVGDVVGHGAAGGARGDERGHLQCDSLRTTKEIGSVTVSKTMPGPSVYPAFDHRVAACMGEFLLLKLRP